MEVNQEIKIKNHHQLKITKKPKKKLKNKKEKIKKISKAKICIKIEQNQMTFYKFQI